MQKKSTNNKLHFKGNVPVLAGILWNFGKVSLWSCIHFHDSQEDQILASLQNRLHRCFMRATGASVGAAEIHGERQIVGSDKTADNAIDGHNCFGVFDRLNGLDHDDDGQVFVGPVKIVAFDVRRYAATAPTALAARGEFHIPDCGFGILH